MAIRVSKIAATADLGTAELIQPSEINPLTLPAIPQENDIWWDVQGIPEAAGSSFTWKIYKSGAWKTIFSAAW
jgi:hypothetical protein